MTIMNAIPITEFKSKCLAYIREVEEHHESISIEKRGHVIAQIIPVPKSSNGGYGCMSGTAVLKDDITESIDEEWGVMGE